MKKITDRMLLGGGVVQDPETLKTVADNIAGRTICAFGEACAWPTQSFVEKFKDEFASRSQEAVAVEFALSGLQFVRQKPIALFYKDHQIGEHRLDFLVEDQIVVELKAISALEDIHFAIGRSYLKATQLQDGLLLNFATAPLTIKRFCRERSSQIPDFRS